ncbi:MAG: glycosyltransferase family 2 protein [bacterium]
MGESISVIIPVYNAANSIVELYQRLTNSLSQISNNYEIIMIDDNSQDNSCEKILRLQKQDNRVKFIKLAKNFGQQNALLCGLNYVQGDYVVTIDDDLQHNPELIPTLYRLITKGYDVVYSIPESREYSFFRKIGSKLTDFLFSILTSKEAGIRVSSYRIMSKDLVKKVIKHKESFVYISVIVLQKTKNIANIYYDYENRKYGKSNYNFRKLMMLFLKIYLYHGNIFFLKYLRSDKPQYIIEKKTGF